MIYSATLSNLGAALSAAQGEFEAVAKDSANPFFKSKYASLPAVVKAATPVLAKHGLSVTQTLGSDTLSTILLHSSGEYIADTATLHLVKDDPQAHGSSVTYTRRYAYMSILGLVADDDDDGNAASNGNGNVVSLTRESPLQKAVDAHPAGSGDKVYLNVPYADKGEAKSAGARWDGPAKRWYVSASADLTKFSKWLDDEGKVDKAIAQVVEAFSDGTPVVEPPPEYSDDDDERPFR